jgi:hypothetical protein
MHPQAGQQTQSRWHTYGAGCVGASLCHDPAPERRILCQAQHRVLLPAAAAAEGPTLVLFWQHMPTAHAQIKL